MNRYDRLRLIPALLVILVLQACVSGSAVDGAEPVYPPDRLSEPGIESTLYICAMKVSNAPAATNRQVVDYFPLVLVDGVKLLATPVRGACLSSGFGKRGSGFHKGVDYHQKPGGPVLAAGDGVVLEKVFRKDYGNMLLLDHGAGVYTRYAHLASINRQLRVGATVKTGRELGLMGRTGRTNATHLHYEILIGNYDNPKRSYGLTPVNPLK